MVVYYSGLLRGLCAVPFVSRVLALVPPWDAGLTVPRDDRLTERKCVGLPRSRAGRVAYEQGVLPLVVRRSGADVLLSTCNVKPFLWRGPSVVVLQSLQYLHFADQFGRARRRYLRAAVGPSLHAADAVIAVTEWERLQAIRIFGLDPGRVTTVYHGVSDAIRTMLEDGVTPQRPAVVADGVPYVLMVSALYGFKNHRRLIEAFALTLRRRSLPHCLVLAGGDADVTREELSELSKDLGVEDRVRLPGAVPHEEVPSLMLHADAVAYPSLYETFGMPILEALSCGRPLLTSNEGAMAEVADGAARLVDPKDTESIAAGLSDVLLNDGLRSELKERGPRRASDFTWQECAERTAQVLAGAVSGHRQGVL
jgi:alpha-1,3-rhamnosyl/mannosyltransferase